MHLVTFERTTNERASATARSALREAHGALEELDSAPAAGRRMGALLPGEGADVVDLNRALALKLALGDAGAPEAEADSMLPADPLAFLRRFDEALIAARAALAFIEEFDGRYDGPDLRALGAIESRRGLRLHAPVPRPGKVLAVARPMLRGSKRAESAKSQQPLLYLKASSAVVGTEASIELPVVTGSIDCDGELAVVIGRTLKKVESHEALEGVAGYTAAGNWGIRGADGTTLGPIGGSCDGFAPLGPALVTPDQLSDPHDLALRTTISGELTTSARTKEMGFPIPTLIAFASSLMTLEPGDVLLTGPLGPPATAGAARELRDGDVVEIQIEGIGTLRSFVTQPGRAS